MSPQSKTYPDTQQRVEPPMIEPHEEHRDDGSGASAEIDVVSECEPHPHDDGRAEDDPRRDALLKLVDEFLVWVEAQAGSQRLPQFVEVGRRKIELGPWERTVIRIACDPEHPDSGVDLDLLAEGIAYTVRCQDLLGVFQEGPMPPPAELPAFLESLVTDLAVGLALADDLQYVIDSRVSHGKLAEAKTIASFRGKLVRLVGDLRDRLGPGELERAEALAADLITPRAAAQPVAGRQLTEDEPDQHSWVTYKSETDNIPPWMCEAGKPPADAEERAAPVDPRSKSSRLKPMLFVLAGLLVIYGIVMFPRVARQSSLPLLEAEHFSALETVVGVKAHPPSLYVTLDAEAWEAQPPDARQALIEEIGRVTEAAGYSGALIRTPDGLTVGRWLQKKGTQLISRPKTAS